MANALRQFDNFESAFSYVRDCNKPKLVMVAGERWKLFPSGCAKNLDRSKNSS